MKPKEKSFSIKFLKDNIGFIKSGINSTFLCSKIPELKCEDCIFGHPLKVCVSSKFDYDFNAIKNHKFGKGKRKVTIKDLEQFKIS